jgi:saccharopine dehydrogenase (NAD+, L-lysine-forming)
MRVAVLGGYGAMGTVVSYVLAKYTGAEVIIVGRNLKKAGETADRLNTKLGIDRVSARHADANKHESLVNVMMTADIAVNCIGPFYRYAAKVCKAAIDARVDLIDICDDFAATKELLTLDEKAKEADITVITGLGSSPGLSNILVKCSADKLDSVNDIKIAWVDTLTDTSGPAVYKHSLVNFAGPTHQYLDGKIVEVPGFSGKEVFEFPPPIGKTEVVYFDHPEPLTLPLYIEGVKNVTVKGGLLPLYIHRLIEDWASYGLISEDPMKVGEHVITPLDFVASFITEVMAPSSRAKEEAPPTGALWVEIVGKKNGEQVRHIYDSVGSMAGGVATPVSIAVTMFSQKKVKVKGVAPPEAGIDPKIFLEELKKRKVALKEVAYIYDFVRI